MPVLFNITQRKRPMRVAEAEAPSGVDRRDQAGGAADD
jgi:hypothetical protein